MLKTLRKKGIAKKILWILAVMITVSFVFWGVSSSLTPQESTRYAGRIDGRKISFEEFQSAFLHTRNQAIMRYGENFHKISSFLDLNSETWERLILLREAQKRRIRVSDLEVAEAIRSLSFFQRNGRFDQNLYLQIVQHVFQSRPREFEEGIRQSLIFQRLYDEETALITVSDNELLEAYKAQHEQIQIDYILFHIEDYKKYVSVLNDEAKIFYAQNKDTFKMPPAINVSFIRLEYPNNANEEKNDLTLALVAQIEEDIQDNKLSLKEIADKHNLPLKESGFISQNQIKTDLQWPLEIFQHAFLLQDREIIGPLDTLKGYYFLELKETKDSHIPEFAQVEEKVKEAVTLHKAKQKTFEVAKTARNFMQDLLDKSPDKDFLFLAQNLNKEVNQTPFFRRGEYLAGIGPSVQFHETAFSLTDQNRISDVVEIENGYAILSFAAFMGIDDKKFDEEKDILRQQLIAQKKDDRFATFIQELKIKANLKDNLRKATEASRSIPQ